AINPVRFGEFKTVMRREYEVLAPTAEYIVLPTATPSNRAASSLQGLLALQDNPHGANAGQDEIDRYFKHQQCDDPKKTPLDLWRAHKAAFLTLSKLALKYLAIPASSVASERCSALLEILSQRDVIGCWMMERFGVQQYCHEILEGGQEASQVEGDSRAKTIVNQQKQRT
ncbi:hypothetical protein BGZ83_007051, partial [Gryganskiella cystojenkinii]